MWGWWILILVTCWPFLAWNALRLRGTLRYRLCIALMLYLSAALPWMAPATSPGLRFCLLLPSLLLMLKTWEVVVNKPRKPAFFADFTAVFCWSVLVPEGERSADAEKRRAVRKSAGKTMLYIGLKCACVFLLLALNDAAELHNQPFLSVMWMGFLLYFSLGAGVDGCRLVSRLLGVDQPDFFNAPPLARNPRDFWGRRWNLWFTKTAHRLIFEPLGGRHRPLLAASGVFIFSAVMHEYMVMVSLERFDGRMLTFFLLHGFATIAFSAFSSGAGRGLKIPRPVAVGLHFVWFMATADLFLAPVDDIFGVRDWGLRVALAGMGLT